MRLATTFILALRSAFNRKATAALTIIAVAVSIMLFAGVETIRQGARQAFERTISGADLIVGARSGPVSLVLYSVFHIGDATSDISWEAAEVIAAREDVAWTIPISMGDGHKGYRVIGTTHDFLDHYQYGDRQNLALAAGEPFEDLFSVVLGAEVAKTLGYKVGDEIELSHGHGEVSFSNHDDKPFTVAGILAPTGTPVDRSLLVSLSAIEAIHLGWQSGVKTPLARMMTADRVRGLPLKPDSVTAVIVGLKSRSGVLQAQRDLNTYKAEPLLAVMPGVALSQLWEVVSGVETALAAISACVVAVGLVVILVSILTSLNERRREMAILRSVGARPGDIFFLLMGEAAFLAFAGTVLGLGALYGGLTLLAPVIQHETGVNLGNLAPGLFDVAVVGGVTGLSALLAMFPAWRAYRNALSDGLSIRV
jgi:putative ABC transport system permease protein